MRNAFFIFALSVAVAIVAVTAVAGKRVQSSGLCTPESPRVALSAVPEASGVAVSRLTPGLVWSMNDSGEPSLFAFDANGAMKARVRVTGATTDDWEDLASAPCRQGSCLYIADIGDNRTSRRTIALYRVPEPRTGDQATAPAETFTAAYPDGAHDAEALFLDSSGRAYIVTKAKSGETALYRWPQLRAGATAMLERLTSLPLEHVTGADASSDNSWVALRTNDELYFYRMRDLLARNGGQPLRVNLAGLKEPQGEGVAFGSAGRVYLIGEGGGRGGTLVSLKCALPQ
jgi:hypothetical protein